MAQVLVNSLFDASLILLVALGFSLVYRTARFFHLGHGATFAVGGYVTYLLLFLGSNIAFALIVAGLIGGLCGFAMEGFLYKRLRRRRSSSLIYLIASLGVLLVVQNLLALLFGSETHVLQIPEALESSTRLSGALFTNAQVMIVAVAIAFVSLLFVFLKTRMGLFLRSLSDNPFLARAMGIDVDRMMLAVFGIGSFLAAVAGGLTGMETTIRPAMGFSGTLYAMLACIMGGMGNLAGTIVGSVLLGVARSASVTFIAPEWRDSIALMVVLILLFVKPGGIIRSS